MVINPKRARDVLEARLRHVLSPEVLGRFSSAQAPKVVLGFPTDEPPFYVAVDEVPEGIEASGGATVGHLGMSFPLRVWLFASHRRLKTASDALIDYATVAMASVLADQQLDGTVDKAVPSLSGTATGADSSRRYIAAGTLTIQCTVSSVCPAEIKEAVIESNGEN